MLDVAILPDLAESVFRLLGNLRSTEREVEWLLLERQRHCLGDILEAGPREDEPRLRLPELLRLPAHRDRRLLAVRSDDHGVAAPDCRENGHEINVQAGDVRVGSL
jgi:hypothetical protein